MNVRLIIGLAVALIAVVVLVVMFRVTEDRSLPERIGDLVLEQTVEGEQAREMLNGMHGKDMTPEMNRIGFYASSGGKAILYTSEYPTIMKAAASFEIMSERIARREGPFTQYNTRNISSRNISVCLGMGQAHYFFVDGKVVYWLAVDVPIASVSAEALVGYVIAE
jgi:hypothetical protein